MKPATRLDIEQARQTLEHGLRLAGATVAAGLGLPALASALRGEVRRLTEELEATRAGEPLAAPEGESADAKAERVAERVIDALLTVPGVWERVLAKRQWVAWRPWAPGDPPKPPRMQHTTVLRVVNHAGSERAEYLLGWYYFDPNPASRGWHGRVSVPVNGRPFDTLQPYEDEAELRMVMDLHLMKAGFGAPRASSIPARAPVAAPAPTTRPSIVEALKSIGARNLSGRHVTPPSFPIGGYERPPLVGTGERPVVGKGRCEDCGWVNPLAMDVVDHTCRAPGNQDTN